MMRNDQATLIVYTRNKAERIPNRTTLFCGRKSVRYSEFYAATQVGITPKYILEFDLGEYENTYVTTSDGVQIPTEIEYNGGHYNVIRSYEPDNYTIEVTIGE